MDNIMLFCVSGDIATQLMTIACQKGYGITQDDWSGRRRHIKELRVF
jgi:hypothetical protein